LPRPFCRRPICSVTFTKALKKQSRLLVFLLSAVQAETVV
jgi:hypothetical protein